MTRYNFTPQQEMAVGQLVTDNWGANFQTSMSGLEPDSVPIIYWQVGPNTPVRSAEIRPDGTIVNL